MGLFYEKLIRPILFLREPEKAHEFSISMLKLLSFAPFLCHLMERYNRSSGNEDIDLFGVKFPNLIGLAAGMDKNAQIWRVMGAFGFGHVEVGTITYQRQPGNPRPRVFRYPEEEAIINRLGFNNDGAERIARRLRSAGAHHKKAIPLGINIGKSLATPLEDAPADYLNSFNLLADYADYFTINVSSPNTPDLRKLQETKSLSALLKILREANLSRSQKTGQHCIPMLLKIAPDLSFSQIDALLQITNEFEIDGIIATNTTLERSGNFKDVTEAGGLSGKPVHEKKLEIIKFVNHETKGRLPIIGVGGIDDILSAQETIDAGASLIQLYTGLIYKGPFLAKKINRVLSRTHS